MSQRSLALELGCGTGGFVDVNPHTGSYVEFDYLRLGTSGAGSEDVFDASFASDLGGMAPSTYVASGGTFETAAVEGQLRVTFVVLSADSSPAAAEKLYDDPSLPEEQRCTVTMSIDGTEIASGDVSLVLPVQAASLWAETRVRFQQTDIDDGNANSFLSLWSEVDDDAGPLLHFGRVHCSYVLAGSYEFAEIGVNTSGGQWFLELDDNSITPPDGVTVTSSPFTPVADNWYTVTLQIDGPDVGLFGATDAADGESDSTLTAALSAAGSTLASAPTPLARDQYLTGTHRGGGSLSGLAGVVRVRYLAASTFPYTNPFIRSPLGPAWFPEPHRCDQGVDFAGNGPIYALGDGIVTHTGDEDPTGFGTYVAYQLRNGPARGMIVYVAEHVTARVSVGQRVSAGVTKIADMYGGIEIGWSERSGDSGRSGELSLYRELGGSWASPDTSCGATAWGRDFDYLLGALGGPRGTSCATLGACNNSTPNSAMAAKAIPNSLTTPLGTIYPALFPWELSRGRRRR